MTYIYLFNYHQNRHVEATETAETTIPAAKITGGLFSVTDYHGVLRMIVLQNTLFFLPVYQFFPCHPSPKFN